jgi:hypothetical protein
MQNDLWRRLQGVFEDALRYSTTERKRYVRETCAGNQELIDELKSLLDAYEQAEEALERPLVIKFGDQEEF